MKYNDVKILVACGPRLHRYLVVDALMKASLVG